MLGLGLSIATLARRILSGGPVPPPTPTPTNTRANTTTVRANRGNFSPTLLAVQQRIAALEG